MMVLHRGKALDGWLNSKLVVIPKKDRKCELPHMRPITIETAALRVFHKWALSVSGLRFDIIPECVVGGVPQRSGIQAWMPASVRAENESRFQGIANDTEKFFDRAHVALAFDVLVRYGMDVSVANIWARNILDMHRYIAIGRIACKRPLKARKGIPQGSHQHDCGQPHSR